MSPRLLALVSLVLYFVGAAFDFAPGGGIGLWALRFSCSFVLLFGYAIWLVIRPDIHVSVVRQRLVIVLSVLAGLATTAISADPLAVAVPWPYVVWPLVAGVFMAPLVIAAEALSEREREVGKPRPLGSLSAVVWLLSGPLGLYFLHQRYLATRAAQPQVEIAERRKYLPPGG